MSMLLIAALVAVALVTTASWALPSLTRPTLPFGVRIPHHRVADPAVSHPRRRYAYRVLGLGGSAAAISASLALLTRPAPVLTITPLALAGANTVAYYLAYREIQAAKRRGGWYADARQGVTMDTTLRTDPVRVPWRWLIPPTLVLAATAVVGIARYGGLPATLPSLHGLGVEISGRTDRTLLSAFAPVLTQLGLTLLVPLLAAGLTRIRPELDAARPAGSARRYRVYLTGVVRLILATTTLANLTLLAIALQIWELLRPSVLVVIVTYLPLALAAAAWIGFDARVGQAGHRLPAEPGEEAEDSGLVQRDDDRHWHLGGFLYANRHDPAIFVHQRAGGASWTMNLGHPVAWAAIATAAVVAALSVIGVIDLPAR